MASAASQAIPPAPPRPAAPGQAPAQTGQQPAQSHPDAPPGGQGPGSFGLLMPILLVLPLLLLILWSSRSQQKKHQQALSSLKKGDRVLTQSGLVGKFVDSDSRYAKLEVAPGVKVEVLRSSLLGKDTGDNQPQKN